jgi:membrane-anchored protein YejM (alkaline phosphatase superfamily)
MKISTSYLLAAYFVWGVISLLVPAGGAMWPIHAPLLVLALLFLVFENRRSRRVLGVILAVVAIAILVVDLNDERRIREKVWRLKIEAGKQ